MTGRCFCSALFFLFPKVSVRSSGVREREESAHMQDAQKQNVEVEKVTKNEMFVQKLSTFKIAEK